jgi:N-acetylmuramoyl-L-alanine amidase
LLPGFHIRIFPCLASVCLAIILTQWFPPQAVALGNKAIDTIVLDPGHTAKKPGAVGVRGICEVVYNDHFTELLKTALTAAGYHVALTRTPGEEVTLEERGERANRSTGIIFLSIHHDSAQLKYLDKKTVAGKTTYQTNTPLRGYSIFISRKNADFDRSNRFAQLLAEEIQRLGRQPTLHHAEMIPGEGRTLLDSRLGIYQFDDLKVLKGAGMPAVLLELGVLVDPVDEAYVSNKANQAALVKAVVRAIQLYLPGSGRAA